MSTRRLASVIVLLAAGAAAPSWAADPLDLGADYSLARAAAAAPMLLAPPRMVQPLGSVARLGLSGPVAGDGLSLQAGERWFARVGLGRSLDRDTMSLGGGYRFADGGALSMQVTRQLGQGRLGLAVRYDWTSTYLRLSYDTQPGLSGGADTLRFSAGMRF